MNLIPNTGPETGNYWCTWVTQSNRLKNIADRKNVMLIRNQMNESFLFGPHGVLHQMEPDIRKDLMVLLDDGWDVPYDVDNPQDRIAFGSLELNEQRFPSFRGTPAERLTALNRAIQALGYRGTGVWVASQQTGEPDTMVAEPQAASYWAQRARWCMEAGVSYWKVDWGSHNNSLSYLAMMTDTVKALSAEHAAAHHGNLRIEHSFVRPPMNQEEPERSAGDAKICADIAALCDYFRLYDFVFGMHPTVAMRRAADLLAANPPIREDCEGRINAEDELYLAAALGCSAGVMRHNRSVWHLEGMDFEKAARAYRFDEVKRMCMWHRIAPPFSMKASSAVVSKEIITHTKYYDTDPTDWPYVGGTTVSQSAPSAIARNALLPVVTNAQALPFVVCSIHPQTGAFSIAALNKAMDDEHPIDTRADVSAKAGDILSPVGMFGRYRSLSLSFEQPLPNGMKILMQDLCGDKAEEVTERVQLEQGRLVIPGALIDQVGTRHASAGDLSDPGLVLQIVVP